MRRSPFFKLLPLALVAGLAACSSINKTLEGDKVDYRTTGSKTVSLEVPPDLSQLQRDSRFQSTDGTISASTIQAPAAAASAPVVAAVAPAVTGEVRIERAGSQRWLSTRQSPEQLWPQLLAFWQERGFSVELEQPATGVMETNWAENRANLPQDFIRRTIGRVFDSAYETGERDRFRTRLERAPDGGTEVYISHRGMVEVYTSERRDSTAWQPRPADPGLEAQMLSRLMQNLGGEEERVRTAAAAASAPPAAVASARARLIDGAPGSGLQVDDGFDRAWRRVGLALDRSGFTVEDRDRTQGLYYVRYVDPVKSKQPEPGFFGKLFGGGKDEGASNALARYRIAVKGQQAESTLVTVQTNQGAPETGDAAQRILQLLVADLR
ncbi:outer membrane protein assembly factor BamC [Methylibium sp.]|uniref:outer membrane protein assembly factor BamC n=1 Tax=Methylibium sp. TaxID=2067992 RepID=UPI001807274A|nr:outer membrane protein assembly factor BamC [Methylibium sp.]MBA3591592.1 outer membrane protein assembly factor BamC [Methylibium sp.]